mgnify:CR=1 FL=1
MAYRVAIVDDSTTDAEFVQHILNSWADLRQANIQAEVFPSAESFLFRYAEDKEWGGAKIYDPSKGIRVNVTAEFVDAKRLKLRGTIMGIGTTLYWTKIK